MITETIHLTGGILIAGQRYKTVVLHENTYGDYLAAQKDVKDENALHYSGLMIIKSISFVGSMDDKGEWIEKFPVEKIDMDALATVNEVDLERMQQCREWIKKKLSWQRSG